MATTWYNSSVIRIEDESPTTKRFWLEIEGVDSFDFKAGQFVTMDLPIGERRRQRWRSYSIANAPDGSNVLEFCIVRLEGGAATDYFFEKVEIGTSIKFKGPDGNFVLPDTIDKDLVFVCTGTGVAPFRSMIQDLKNRKVSHGNIHLIFGTRFQNGILYKDEFEQLVKELPGFRYSVTLSKEENFHLNGQQFDLKKGYVHQVYLENYPEKNPNLSFYLCGWTKMVDEAVANLILKIGFDRTQVKYELYG